MTLEEQLAELKKGLETALETKNAEQIKSAMYAFDEKAKGLFADEIKAAKEALTAEFKSQIKAVQDHADKLDARLQERVTITTPEAAQKSFDQVIHEALIENTDNLAKFERKETKNLVIELKAVGDMSTANVTGGNRYGQVYAPEIHMNPNRKVHMSDILPGGNIGPGNSFTFMRENGVGEGNFAPVAEGALKPQFDLDLVEATVQIETIAGWMRVTRKAMNNIPGFASYLSQRLPDKFERVKDAQILYGNGTTPNLKGILTSGNFVASTATISDKLIEKLITDIAVLEDTYERDATGIVLRPLDYYGFFKNKATGSGEYDLPMGVTFVGNQMYLFGIPVYASTAITSPDYIVGDFAMGAQLLTQEGMRIEFFEQDGTNVRENKVTVRVEGNYALPVYGPDYFIKGTTALA